MKKTKLITTALAPIILTAPLGGLSGLVSCKTKSDNVEKHIFSINDLHGAAPGFGDDFFNLNSKNNAGMVRIVNEIRPTINKYPGSFLVSAGDTNAGESFSTSQQGRSLYPVLQAADVRYSAVGNHAWDYGLDKLHNKDNDGYDAWARTKNTKGNWFLASNILESEDYVEMLKAIPWKYDDICYRIWNDVRVKWADPYKVVDMDGHNICLIGLTTHDTVTDGNREALTTTAIMEKQYYNTAVGFSKRLAKEQLGDSEYNKIEAFILLTHCDSEQADGPGIPGKEITGEATYIAEHAHENNSNVDAIISAHSHKIVAGTVKNTTLNKDIWIGQAGVSGQHYLDTKIVFNDKKKTGNRLKKIEMKVCDPVIEGKTDPSIDAGREKAAAQLTKIYEDATDPVVMNTINTYEVFKTAVRENLSTPMSECTKNGLDYWYYSKDGGASLGTTWMQSETLVEPIGVWSTLSQTLMFSAKYATANIYRPSIAFNNLDSYKSYIPANTTSSDNISVTKEFGYALHPYENKIRYGCLTPYQLRQYINYFLDGGTDLFNYKDKVQYIDITTKQPIKFYCDGDESNPTNEVKWDEKNELVVQYNSDPKVKVKVPGVATSCGCVQFFGLRFDVELKRTDASGNKIYKLPSSPNIKIYDYANIEDPSQWKDITTYASEHGGYIPVTMSSFCWQGGNAQNRMLNHWFEYNYSKEIQAGHPDIAAKIQCREFDYYTRQASFDYMSLIGFNGCIDLLPSGDRIDSAYCAKLIHKPA